MNNRRNFLKTTAFGAGALAFSPSFNHLFGKKELPTKDHSTNNWWLFPFLLGENWHNNHHYYPSSASTWVKWYQVDFIYIVIKSFEKLRLVWNVKTFSA